MTTTSEARIAEQGGVPTLFINGKPVSGLAFQTYCPTPRHFESFAQAGVRLVTVGSFATDRHYAFKVVWPQPGVYDFSALDAVVGMVLKANPDAYFFPRIYLWAPEWWQKNHPNDLRRTADGQPAGGHALASPAWRQDTADFLRRLIKHVEAAPYAGHVIGYHLTSEETEEWFYRERKGGSIDYSLPNVKAFRRWLKDRYGSVEQLRAAWSSRTVDFDTADLPKPERRQKADVDIFYDPKQNRQTIDFYSFHSWIMADTIRFFAGVVKEASARHALVGVFYGYLLQAVPGGMADSGHMALDEVLSCPDVDFLCSPTCYAGRELGSGYSYFMAPVASVKLHGKLWFDENDVRTHLNEPVAHNNSGAGKTLTLEDTISMQWRQFGNQLGNGTMGWWMDQGGGWYDDPPLMEEIGKIVCVGKAALAFDRSSAAEIAVVLDEKTTTMCLQRGLRSFDGIVPLGHIGTPVDFLLLDDLELARPYKLYIFKYCYRTNQKIIAALEKMVKRDGHWVIWVGMPGVLDEDTATVAWANSEKFTGLKTGSSSGTFVNADFETGPYRGRKFDHWTSLYSPGIPDGGSLKAICRQAGVHLYVATQDVVYANRSFLCIHSAGAGKRTVRLPKASDVYDVRNDKPVCSAAASFEVEMRANATQLYFLGSSAEWQRAVQANPKCSDS